MTILPQVFDSDGHSRFSVHASGTSFRGLHVSNGAFSTGKSMEEETRGNGIQTSMDDLGITAQVIRFLARALLNWY